MKSTSTRPEITVTADGSGVVSHVGSWLLAGVADRSTLCGQLSEALAGLRKPRTAHDPGRVLVDLAVAVADGARTISDIAVLGDQAVLFGPVASDSTCWRLLDALDDDAFAAVGRARAAARETVWAQHAEIRGAAFPPAMAAGVELAGIVLDADASLVECHSEKEQAAPTYKGGFGYHPLMVFCDNTGEFLAGELRRGNAGANTAADHIAVLDRALAQLPEAHRYGTPVLLRADSAGCSKDVLAHLRGLREQGVSCEFSVGWRIGERERDAIATIPNTVWADAIDSDGQPRDGAGLAEITGVLPAGALTGYPSDSRVLVRRERPHPGAQLDLFEQADGWRYTAFVTDTQVGQLAFLDARHRAHARVEDRIRCAKNTGLDHLPSREFAINTGWLQVVMLAVDLLAWTQHLLLDGDLAKAEPPHPALPAAAHRRPPDPRTAPPVATHPAALALGRRAGRRLRPPRCAARPRQLIRRPRPCGSLGAPGRPAGRTPPHALGPVSTQGQDQ